MAQHQKLISVPWVGLKIVAPCSTVPQTCMFRSAEQFGLQPSSYEFKVDQYQLDMLYDHWKSEGLQVGWNMFMIVEGHILCSYVMLWCLKIIC
jgi:hypothetical protein